jgi:hypothetical protein
VLIVRQVERFESCANPDNLDFRFGGLEIEPSKSASGEGVTIDGLRRQQVENLSSNGARDL